MPRLAALAVSAVTLLAASLIATAQGATNLSLSIRVSGTTVLAGHDVTLSGRLSNGEAGRSIVVYSHRYGAGLRRIATVTTAAHGDWSLRVMPVIETSYQARLGSVVTPSVGLAVQPAISTKVLADGSIRAHVVGGRSFAGRSLELQRAAGGRWTTIEKAVLGRDSAAVFRAPFASGRASLRVALSVNEAGPGLLGGRTDAFPYSRPSALSLQSLSLTPSSFKVLYGHAVTLTGTVSGGRSGEHVSILAKPYGTGAAIQGATVLTLTGGHWSFRVEPSIETIYQARLGTRESRPVVIGVAPRVSVELLSNGHITARVLSKRALAGRQVELQELNANHAWTTIARANLDRRASAVFGRPAGGGALTLRVAMSVNQAGAGLLGTTSHAFVDRV